MKRPEQSDQYEPVDAACACLRKTDAHIDDLHQARVWAGIDAHLGAGRSRSWTPRFVLSAAAATLCLCVATGLVIRSWHGSSQARAISAASKASAPAASLAPAQALLAPYVVSGATPSQLLDGQHSRVEIPPGGLMRATVAGRARMTLIGPAELTVVSASHEAIELALHYGILLCDYQHQDGSRLRVRSPGAETVVVGTLFSVEATRAGSIVSVTRGRVEVVRSGRTVQVGEGRRLLPALDATEPLAGVAADRLAEHEASVLPPQGEAGVLSVVAEASSEPIWLGGRLLGTPPLTARLTSGPVALLVGGSGARRAATAPIHQVETLVLPGKTAVALIDGHRSEGPGSPATIHGGWSPRSRHDRSPASAPALVATPPREALPQIEAKPVDAEDPPAEIYARAELAMKKGDRALGKRILQTLVDRFPEGALAASARYEIARMAFAAGEWESARGGLAQLEEGSLAPALGEPVHYLRCRVEVARADRPRATACLAEFRRNFPSSPHDAEVLSLLASYRFDESCTSALPLLDEYLRRYPQGTFAKEADKRKQHCRP